MPRDRDAMVQYGPRSVYLASSCLAHERVSATYKSFDLHATQRSEVSIDAVKVTDDEPATGAIIAICPADRRLPFPSPFKRIPTPVLDSLVDDRFNQVCHSLQQYRVFLYPLAINSR